MDGCPIPCYEENPAGFLQHAAAPASRNFRPIACRMGLGAAAAKGYTAEMDSVRFGRVLGIGTRLAAKTVAAAMDAATAPNPNPATKPPANQTSNRPSETAFSQAPPSQAQPASRAAAAGERAAAQTRRASSQVKQAHRGAKQGGKRFGEAVWGPFTKAGRVLWLEFTGVFFGIFALYGLTEVWRQRAYWRDATHHDQHTHFLMGCLMLVVFGYFTLTSFSRARRRSLA